MTEKDGIKCRAVVAANKAKYIWVVSAHLRVDETLYQRVDDLLAQRGCQV